jgi:hypothetical protein
LRKFNYNIIIYIVETSSKDRVGIELKEEFERYYRAVYEIREKPPSAMVIAEGQTYHYYEVASDSPLLTEGEWLTIYKGKILVSAAVGDRPQDGVGSRAGVSQADLVRHLAAGERNHAATHGEYIGSHPKHLITDRNPHPEYRAGLQLSWI